MVSHVHSGTVSDVGECPLYLYGTASGRRLKSMCMRTCVHTCVRVCALESTLCIKDGDPFLLNISIEMSTGWPLGRDTVGAGGNRRDPGSSQNTLVYLLAYLLGA